MPLSIREYLQQGPATSKEIQAATGLNQVAVSRQLRGMGDSVIKLPNGRSPRYALTRNAFGGDDKLPLVMMDAHGNSTLAAYIRPLAHGGFFVAAETGMPSILLGENGDGLYDDLPYFLDDLSPQGFLGRQIAEEMASQSDDFPPDPRHWNASHIGRYLISNGDDLSGNLKFGQQALWRVRRKPVVRSVQDYPALADSVMSGVIPGSSAGGEQPKFTAFCGDCSAHVIVKFSPKGNDAIAWRWRDILITEYHATEAIHAQNFPAAETRLIEMEGRLFLQSQRFDRSGEYGRKPMLSLQSVDAEFTGLGSDWPRVMVALERRGLVHKQYVYDAAFLWAFGRLINNTDMHLGNLSLAMEGSVFRLLPVYDMCSMGFAPKSGGEVAPYGFIPPEISGPGFSEELVSSIMKMAHDFWERVAGDERISDEFRAFLSRGNPVI
ncbi:MAG: type II toxin-antitoxin system HipA family toxin YjjJ [Gammaproteobacteria bacterium]|nr:type II toxin-antitoxin system HipA family toxin YjjJ [Gammaproteobacteria bacterium]MCF6364482.1 type II toxin-antitoxin system HipA family toxin YjjJ [Gammaproteobacteria bacterium]